MKAGSFAIAAIASLAAAQPHKNAHKHKRDVAVVTEVEYATVTAPNVMIYVDQNGNPVSTSYAAVAAAATKAPAAPAAFAPAPAAPKPVVAAPKPAPAAPKSAPVAPAADNVEAPAAPVLHVENKAKPSSTPASTTSEDVASSGPGIAYSPYNADNTCKSASQVQQDLAQLSEYSMIRLYGVDCNQVENVLAAKTASQKIFAGFFDINSVESEAQTLISAVGGNWDAIDTVSVGNELLNQHSASAGQLVSAINAAKGALKPAGYAGPVVYVDTFNAMIAQNGVDKSLCEASDYSAANAHAFFDSTVEASGAGAWVKSTAEQIAASCPGKKVVITESGWPSAGNSNGAAIPSKSNQQAADSSIREAMAGQGLILFSAYNDLWKANAQWNFFAEQSWGIYGTSTA